MTEPRPHAKSHYHQPLANRLIDGAVRKWMDAYLGTAEAAGSSDGIRAGVRWARSYLDEHSITLTPEIVDQLQRAGLLTGGAGSSLPSSEASPHE